MLADNAYDFIVISRKIIFENRGEVEYIGTISIALDYSPIQKQVDKIILHLALIIGGLLLVFFTELGWKGLILGHLFGQFILALYSIYTFFNEHL